jgi:AP-2 complex subunit mu-1
VLLQRRAMESRNATMQVTGAVSWRREGLKYKKNEVYLDIVESINVLMTAKGARACAASASSMR